MLLVHLSNLPLKVGCLEIPVGLWTSLRKCFGHPFFRVGLRRDPHVTHLQAHLGAAAFRHRMRHVASTALDLHSLLCPKPVLIFKAKSLLVQRGEADREPVRIPRDETNFLLSMWIMHLMRANLTTDDARRPRSRTHHQSAASRPQG